MGREGMPFLPRGLAWKKARTSRAFSHALSMRQMPSSFSKYLRAGRTSTLTVQLGRTQMLTVQTVQLPARQQRRHGKWPRASAA